MDSGKNLFLAHLYESYSNIMHKIAFSKLNCDKEKAEEIVQEAFAIACMKVDVIYQSDCALAWLLRVQDYLIKREHFRLCQGKTEEGEYVFLKEVSIDALSIEQIPIEQVEFYEESIFEELESILTKRELKFIEERYLNNKKYKEIAASLHITETACTSFGSRIHKKIKKNLEKRDKTPKNLDI